MVKFVKVSDNWSESRAKWLVEEMRERDIEGIVVKDSECEIYDGDLEKITIEGEEVLEEERFSGDSLFGVN